MEKLCEVGDISYIRLYLLASAATKKEMLTHLKIIGIGVMSLCLTVNLKILYNVRKKPATFQLLLDQHQLDMLMCL